MSDVWHGSRWQTVVESDKVLCPNKDLGRNLMIGISADGVSPMKHRNYSLWPVALNCWNLPAYIRMTLPALWVSYIVPPFGEHHGEANDFQMFMCVIVDDLNYAYAAGVEVKDSLYS